jgi:hypothetical protein
VCGKPTLVVGVGEVQAFDGLVLEVHREALDLVALIEDVVCRVLLAIVEGLHLVVLALPLHHAAYTCPVIVVVCVVLHIRA